MGIKSKPVDPQRAAAAARGQLGNPGSTSGQKHSFYYEPERQRQQRERDDETSSNSSVDSTSPSTANTTEARALPPTFQTEADVVRGRNEDSSDDEALAAARERTRRFLYPDSERNYVPQPYHNARLEVYERRRMELETEERLRRIAKEEAEREDAPAAPEPAPPTAIPVDTSHAAHSLPQPQHSDATKKEETPAPPLITKEEFDGLVRAMHAAQPSGYSIPTTLLHSKPPSHGTRPPQVRTFAQLQDNALQQLYADWQREEDDEDGSSEKDGQRRAFVATQHTSAAFTLAALEAARQDARRRESSAMFGGISDRPFTLEELAAAETQRRNARRGGHESSGAQWMDAGGIASRAQMELHTFFQCVHWVERIVRDPRFLESVGSFLFRHHQVFLRHYNASAGCVMEDAFFNGEHSHDELRVYEEFGTKLSELINKVLQEHISGFDEAEFVETLFDTPVGADINSQPVPKHGVRGPQNVLTYPAWRLILAMSSFPSFFAYMMDYIQEEYNLEEATGTEIAVGGSRGVRALVSSMYRNQDAEATLDEEQARLTGTAPDALANAAVTEEAPISSLPPPPSTTTTAVVPEVPSAWSPDMTPPPLPTPGTTIELTPVVVPKRGKTKPNSLPCSADGMTKKPTEATRNRLGSPNDRVTSAGSNPPPPPSTSGTGELPTLKKAKGRLSAPTTGTTTTSSTVTPRVTPATTRTPSNARKGVKPKLKRPGK